MASSAVDEVTNEKSDVKEREKEKFDMSFLRFLGTYTLKPFDRHFFDAVPFSDSLEQNFGNERSA